MSRDEEYLISEEHIKHLCSPFKVVDMEQKTEYKTLVKENVLQAYNSKYKDCLKEKDFNTLNTIGLELANIEIKFLVFKPELIDYILPALIKIKEKITDMVTEILFKKSPSVNDKGYANLLSLTNALIKTAMDLLQLIKDEIVTEKKKLEWRYFYCGAVAGIVLVVGTSRYVGEKNIANYLKISSKTVPLVIAGTSLVGSLVGGYSAVKIAKFFEIIELYDSQKNVIRKQVEIEGPKYFVENKRESDKSFQVETKAESKEVTVEIPTERIGALSISKDTDQEPSSTSSLSTSLSSSTAQNPQSFLYPKPKLDDLAKHKSDNCLMM